MFNCFKCQAPLTKRFFKKLPFHYCASCEGKGFIDRHLKSVLKKDLSNKFFITAKKSKRISENRCYLCHDNYKLIKRNDMIYDVCPKCRVLWCDPGEFEGLEPDISKYKKEEDTLIDIEVDTLQGVETIEKDALGILELSGEKVSEIRRINETPYISYIFCALIALLSFAKNDFFHVPKVMAIMDIAFILVFFKILEKYKGQAYILSTTIFACAISALVLFIFKLPLAGVTLSVPIFYFIGNFMKYFPNAKLSIYDVIYFPYLRASRVYQSRITFPAWGIIGISATFFFSIFSAELSIPLVLIHVLVFFIGLLI